MNAKKAAEQLMNIVGRLETWQNKPSVKRLLQLQDSHGTINSVKSELLKLVNRMESPT